MGILFVPFIYRLKDADGIRPVRARPLSSHQSAERDFCLPCRADLAEGGIPLFDCPTVPEYINNESVVRSIYSSETRPLHWYTVLINKRSDVGN